MTARSSPLNASTAPSDTPIRANGPIKHVFFIVRRTAPTTRCSATTRAATATRHLTLFGKRITPNLHALVRRFPLLDHVYANSEASIDGHYWTAAGAVSDYVTKNWHQNYAGRGRPYDFGAYEVSAPPKGYIFQRALAENIPFFNYGEALAGLSPFPDKDRTAAETADQRPGPQRTPTWGSTAVLRRRHRDLQPGRRQQRRRLRLLGARRRPADVALALHCFKTRFQSQLADQLGAGAQLHRPCRSTTRRASRRESAPRTPTWPTTTGASARSSRRSPTRRSGRAR